MHIEWSITKKRGNYRPVLNFTITLSDFENGLAMPAVRVQSTIPKPPETGWTHCWPGQFERGDRVPEECYLLMTPSHKSRKSTESLRLPWREDNEYPEVEESFALLRQAFEAALAKSSQSAPMSAKGSLETTAATKKTIAPAFAAERILQVVKG